MEEKNLTCIGCPMGCFLTVKIKDGEVQSVEGNSCKRGSRLWKKRSDQSDQNCDNNRSCIKWHGKGRFRQDKRGYSKVQNFGLYPGIERGHCYCSSRDRRCGSA